MKRIALFAAILIIISFTTSCASDIDNNDENNQRELYLFQTERNNSSTSTPNENMTNPKNTSNQENTGNNTSAVPTGNTDKNENSNPLTIYFDNKEDFPLPNNNVDIDFAALDNKKFYEMFTNVLIQTPEDYLGQTLRLVGPYYGETDDSGKDFNYIIMMDESGCCPIYVEIMWGEGNELNQYPEDFVIVDVDGVYKSYYDEELDWTFHYLEIKNISILEGGNF